MRQRVRAIGMALVGATFLFIIPQTARAGGWITPTGILWWKITAVIGETTREYDFRRDRQGYLDGGEASWKGVIADLWWGFADGWDLTLQVPLLDLSFTNPGLGIGSTGLGDVRFNLRRSIWRGERAVLSGRIGAKAPTGDYQIGITNLPLGEGQWDVEGGLAAGLSLWPKPAYLTGELGWRYRARNDEAQTKPGDEFFYSFEGGVDPLVWLGIKAEVRGLVGTDPEIQGIVTSNSAREALQLYLGLRLSTPDRRWTLETGWARTLSGRNFPQINEIHIGLYSTLEVF